MMNKIDVISKIMDESNKESVDLSSKLEHIRIIIDEKLIPSIEKVQYKKKYHVINEIKNLISDISLYHLFPETENQNIICFYNPDKKIISQIRKSILSGSNSISDLFPTLIHNSNIAENTKILNISNNIITFSGNEYTELLEIANNDDLNISTLINMCSVRSQNLPSNLSYLIFNDKINPNNKYFNSFYTLPDYLVITGKVERTEELLLFRNVKKILICGDKSDYSNLTEWCSTNQIKYEFCNDISGISELTFSDSNNYCYKALFDNLFYEIRWYLANKHINISSLLENVKDNLLFNENEDKTFEAIKEIQENYLSEINEIERTDSEYQTICNEITNVIDELQADKNIIESKNNINTHINMSKIIPDILIKIGTIITAKYNSDNGLKDKFRYYSEILSKVSDKQFLNNVLFGHYMHSSITNSDIDSFIDDEEYSEMIIKAKTIISEAHNIPVERCGSFLSRINTPDSLNEKRMLGVYYLNAGNKETAKKYLYEAALSGDDNSCSIFINEYNPDNEVLQQLAHHGCKDAALILAKNLEDDNDECIFCLKIAASKGSKKAINRLGHIAYDNHENDKALHYYKLSESIGSSNKKIFERMAILFFENQNYSDAEKYAEKSGSAESEYIIGQIYENGLGKSANADTALKHYEAAVKQGHYNAQVCVEKINAKKEAEKAKEVVKVSYSSYYSSYTSYSSYSSYSGYYTSYYSGW